MNKHTATPWEWRGYADTKGLCHINADGKTIVQVWDFPEAEANVAYIVKAVNAHESLVKKLAIMTQLCLLKYGNLDTLVYTEIQEAQELLKLAGEE